MPAMPAMPAMPSAPSVPQWSQVASIGVCSPASAAADVQGEDDSKPASEAEPDSMAPANQPPAELWGGVQSDTADDGTPAASASKFAEASEAAKHVIAAVGSETPDGKRGRRRGAATRVTDRAAVAQADAKEENDTKDNASWRRGCTPSMPSMSALPTREGLAGRLSCAASRKEAEGDAATEEAPSVMQRLACTGARKTAGPAVDAAGQEAGAPVSYLARVKAAATCSASAPAADGTTKGIVARVRDTVSCSSARGAGDDGETQETEDTGNDQGSKDASLLSRLKEASTCSPTTQVRVQAAMSHLPELPKMPEMPSQLSCAAPRSGSADGDAEAVSASKDTPSMLGRVKAAASCGYLPATASPDGHQLQPMEAGAGEGVLNRCPPPCLTGCLRCQVAAPARAACVRSGAHTYSRPKPLHVSP